VSTGSVALRVVVVDAVVVGALPEFAPVVG
jgi:hypothetical protein